MNNNHGPPMLYNENPRLTFHLTTEERSPMNKSIDFDLLLGGDFRSPRLTSPTCRDLGIPDGALETADDVTLRGVVPQESLSEALSPKTRLNLLGVTYEYNSLNNPFSPHCQIPLPEPYGGLYGMEPTFIRKRNERERERVRCVNEGYAQLREHLPLENKEKRISKVETLRSAIKYIEYLQEVLGEPKEKKVGPSKQRISQHSREEATQNQRPAKKRKTTRHR